VAKVPIGLELYSVRHELEKDLRGTLRAVAAMGYEGVEFAGPPKHSAAELRSALEETGLTCCGWHTPFALVQDNTLDGTIALNQALGNKFVILPSAPQEMRSSREGWLEFANFLDALARKLAPHGMQTGYHNHAIEFEALDGEAPWDTIFGNTAKEVVMQLDTGNAARGGADVVAVLERYPGRANSVHLKPYTWSATKDDPRQGFKPVIGQDEMPWDDIFRVCETTGGTEWYVVEYESDAYPPLEAVERCLRGLRAMGK
jgi:sugar phosphate isomerase/epimerase